MSGCLPFLFPTDPFSSYFPLISLGFTSCSSVSSWVFPHWVTPACMAPACTLHWSVSRTYCSQAASLPSSKLWGAMASCKLPMSHRCCEFSTQETDCIVLPGIWTFLPKPLLICCSAQTGDLQTPHLTPALVFFSLISLWTCHLPWPGWATLHPLSHKLQQSCNICRFRIWAGWFTY